jgi:hypothetical protein
MFHFHVPRESALAIKPFLKDFVANAVARIVPRGVFCDKRYFNLWQSRGYHITPVHFYEPVPDTRTLPDDHWDKPSEMVGVSMNEAAQLEYLAEFTTRYKQECEALQFIHDHIVDWEVLYCMIRHFKPRRMIEIGSGTSTRVSAMALEKNREELGIVASLTAIEPYPRKDLVIGFPGLTTLKREFVQNVDLAEFEQLEENDIFFIDSSHMLKTGSVVWYEFLEILPRLKQGVIIHVHDIFLPYDYRRDWALKRSIFWNEQYLLQAFLAFNDSFEVILANSFLHHRHPAVLRQAFPWYDPEEHIPGSFWFRRVAGRNESPATSANSSAKTDWRSNP